MNFFHPLPSNRDALIIFVKKKIGIKPINIMAVAGAAASIILSSEACIYVETAKVSKLNGRKINVAGNSLPQPQM